VALTKKGFCGRISHFRQSESGIYLFENLCPQSLQRYNWIASKGVCRLPFFQFLKLPHRGHLTGILATEACSCQNSPGNISPQCGQFLTFGLMFFTSCRTASQRTKLPFRKKREKPEKLRESGDNPCPQESTSPRPQGNIVLPDLDHFMHRVYLRFRMVSPLLVYYPFMCSGDYAYKLPRV
jgi:hypothetical protein